MLSYIIIILYTCECYLLIVFRRSWKNYSYFFKYKCCKRKGKNSAKERI